MASYGDVVPASYSHPCKY